MTETEAAFKSLIESVPLNSEDKDRVRSKVKSLALTYMKHKPSISKLHKNYLKVLRNLAKDKDIYVSKFDKGNGICITDKSDYVDFMSGLLNDTSKFSPYQKHGRTVKDPFIVAENKFNRSLSLLKSDGSISPVQYNQIRSSGSQPPRLYGLPKVHKSTTELTYRPILSMSDAYPSKLSKWLDELLKPYIPKKYLLKDSFEFVDKIRDLKISNSFSVSFDVRSLFTNVPLDDTIDHICKIIDFQFFPINEGTLRTLLSLACKNILFQFNEKLFLQNDGVAMGSKLGPTLASFAMDLIENNFENGNQVLPLFYQRYVDEVYAIFDSKKIGHRFFGLPQFLSQKSPIHHGD